MDPHEVASLVIQSRAVTEHVLALGKRFRFTGINNIPGNLSTTSGSSEGVTGTTDPIHPEANIKILSTELEALKCAAARLDEAAYSAESQLDKAFEARSVDMWYCGTIAPVLTCGRECVWQRQLPTSDSKHYPPVMIDTGEDRGVI